MTRLVVHLQLFLLLGRKLLQPKRINAAHASHVALGRKHQLVVKNKLNTLLVEQDRARVDTNTGGMRETLERVVGLAVCNVARITLDKTLEHGIRVAATRQDRNRSTMTITNQLLSNFLQSNPIQSNTVSDTAGNPAIK